MVLFFLIQLSCVILMAQISWKRNHEFDEDTTIHEAISLANSGRDGGLRGAFIVKPTTRDVTEWIQFYGYLLLLTK